ncbi:MAG: protease complex subunit PrcB family protein [Roseburia sp.]|nr:protease complex subunit PrcB family protein [Roseburia sp.]
MRIYKRRYFYPGILILTVFYMALCLFGCGVEKTDESKVEDIDYCIVEESDIPKELMAKIQEKKAADLKMVFENDDFVYIVRGYGEQETGGYSIQVTDVFLTKNAVVFRSNLVGPSKEEVKNAVPSYPYVVLKIQNMGKNVIFE